VRAGADVAEAQRQPRLGAFERLALAFFVAAKHQRLLRRVEVKADHVPELRLELRVARELEGARAVGLEVVGPPQPMHGPDRNAGVPRHGAHRPAGVALGRAGDFGEHARLLVHLQGALAPAPFPVLQSCQTLRRETAFPLPDLVARESFAPPGFGLRETRAAVEQNPAAVRHPLRSARSLGGVAQRAFLLRIDPETCNRSGHAPP